jgi:hypothetical protein
MMSARTSFLVWWGLPILCAGMGAGAAAFMGQGGTFGVRPGQIGPLMLLGGYLAAVGLLAVIFRVRQSQAAFDDRDRFDKPVEAALVALCAPILALGIWVFANGFLGDFGPIRTLSGKLASIDQIGAFGRSYGIALDRSPRPLILECRLRRNCGSPVPLMRLQPGSAVEIHVLKSAVVGLSANGRTLVDPNSQRRARLLLGGAALAGMVFYSLAFAAASFRLLFGRDEREEEEAWQA